MARISLLCADVPLRNYSLTHSLGRSMPAGCNCGPNSPLERALGCHCLCRGTAVNASQLPLPRLYSAAVQDCKWRYIKLYLLALVALNGRVCVC